LAKTWQKTKTKKRLPLTDTTGNGASSGISARILFYWKSIISKLVGEGSLTGFLFVYASQGAVC
jgi:hypothetical protein